MVGVPSSCALLGGFAIGAWVSLLRQHSAEREMSASACTLSEILSVISHNLRRSRDPEHTPRRVVYDACTCTRLVTKFNMRRFIRCKDMTGAQNLKIDHVTTPSS